MSISQYVYNKHNNFFTMLERNSINVHSNTRPLLAKVRTGWPYRWLEIFFIDLAKSPLMLRSSWILNECNLNCKIVKYCSLSEVCMIKTVPHTTVSPQRWCINGLVARFCKVNLSNAKTPAWSKMIASFCVYIRGYQLDVRFGPLLGCLQIIFL